MKEVLNDLELLYESLENAKKDDDLMKQIRNLNFSNPLRSQRGDFFKKIEKF